MADGTEAARGAPRDGDGEESHSERVNRDGLFFLALAIVGAIALIADFIYGPAVPLVSAALGAVLFAVLWLVLPAVRRNPKETPD